MSDDVLEIRTSPDLSSHGTDASHPHLLVPIIHIFVIRSRHGLHKSQLEVIDLDRARLLVQHPPNLRSHLHKILLCETWLIPLFFQPCDRCHFLTMCPTLQQLKRILPELPA
jgi:hypothetical protein